MAKEMKGGEEKPPTFIEQPEEAKRLADLVKPDAVQKEESLVNATARELIRSGQLAPILDALVSSSGVLQQARETGGSRAFTICSRVYRCGCLLCQQGRSSSGRGPDTLSTSGASASSGIGRGVRGGTDSPSNPQIEV